MSLYYASFSSLERARGRVLFAFQDLVPRQTVASDRGRRPATQREIDESQTLPAEGCLEWPCEIYEHDHH